MVAYFRHLTVNFNLHTGVKQPNMTSKERFYKVYSPLKSKGRPRDDICLDLRLDIQTPETFEPWSNLLPSLKRIGLHIENSHWVENKTKGNTNQLHIPNRSFNHTIDVKNPMYWFYFFIR